MANISSTRDRVAAVAVLLVTVITIAVNILAALGYINGVTPESVSAKYPTAITPAGYAFSIWSLIYLGMIVFSIYQLSQPGSRLFRSIRIPYILSCVLNCAWIYAWHHELIAICSILITGLLVTLFWVCLELRQPASFITSLISKAPFGLYFGWVTCATLVNFAAFLSSRGFDAQNSGLAIASIIAATVCAILVRWKMTNYLYPLAVAWALTAIALKHSGNTAIVLAAAFGTVTCLVTAGSVVTNLKDSTSEQG